MNDSRSRETPAVVLLHVVELALVNGPFDGAFIEPDKSPQLTELSLRDDLLEATGTFSTRSASASRAALPTNRAISLRDGHIGAWRIIVSGRRASIVCLHRRTSLSWIGPRRVVPLESRAMVQSTEPLTDTDYQRVLNWQAKVVDLMNEHMIGRAGGAGFYVVSLRTTSGFPECSIFSPNQSGGLDVAIRRMNVVEAKGRQASTGAVSGRGHR